MTLNEMLDLFANLAKSADRLGMDCDAATVILDVIEGRIAHITVTDDTAAFTRNLVLDLGE